MKDELINKPPKIPISGNQYEDKVYDAYWAAKVNENTKVDLITIPITINKNLKTEFETFFKKRQMSLSNGLQFVMEDYLLKHRTKNLEEMMNQYRLSSREKEVAILTCKGFRTKEIAKSLFVSKDTISTHLKNIYRKCNVTNAVQLVNLLSQNKV